MGKNGKKTKKIKKSKKKDHLDTSSEHLSDTWVPESVADESNASNVVIPAKKFNVLIDAMNDLCAEVKDLKTQTEQNKDELAYLRANQSTGAPSFHEQEPHKEPVYANSPRFPNFQMRNANYFYPLPREKLQELPTFSGKPGEWPMFIASYRDTTTAFAYTNRENLMRLQKCLVGDAKDAVMSLLIYPDDVENVISELQFRFGRADVLVRNQLSQIRKLPTIDEQKLEDLIPFASAVRNMVACFTSAQCTQQLNNPFLLEELVRKLPANKRYEWAQYAAQIKPYATMANLSNWLSEVARIVCFMPPSLQIKKENQQPRRLMHMEEETNESGECKKDIKPTERNIQSTERNIQSKCAVCEGDHFVANCRVFGDMKVNERWEKVKSLHLCICCLRRNHQLSNCRNKTVCATENCRRNHHKLLHDNETSNKTQYMSGQQNQNKNEKFGDTLLNCNLKNNTTKILFKCVPINMFGPNGNVRALAIIDEGSSVSLLENETAQLLGLNGQQQTLRLQWYGNKITNEKSTNVNCEISDSKIDNRFHIKNLKTINNLNLKAQTFNKNEYVHLASLPVQNYFNEKPVILLGMDNAHLTKPMSIVCVDEKSPIAIKTKLGWIAYGPTGDEASTESMVLHIRPENPLDYLQKVVDDFFDTENFGLNNISTNLDSEENQLARELLVKTTKRVGRQFETGLLWKSQPCELPESFEMAKSRLMGIENKMLKNPKFADKYKQEMQKYFEKGYARVLSEEEIKNISSPIWYLPHFGVQTPYKPEKLRIVFDAAAEAQGISLNSVLSKGPEQAKSLADILFKFREGQIAVAADIREMFSQIKICVPDQSAQRFLWRNGDKTQPIQHCQMTSMIFGAICSPCCAEFVKNFNALQFADHFPDAVKAIIDRHYVDDFVCSFDDGETAERVCKEDVHIHREGGFELRNFLSNSKWLEALMNGDNVAGVKSINMEKQANVEKILGMYWNRHDDTFEFCTKFHRISPKVLSSELPPTKRELLGIVMAVFDPYGLLADFMIYAKILVQDTWKTDMDWDETIPASLAAKWKIWWSEFKNVTRFSIPRCYSPGLIPSDGIELHVFVDASQVAFAAVAYFRFSNGDVKFVAGKTRTAPKKTLSIPRLELQSAILGLRLSVAILKGHELPINSTTYWSDSRTVIQWINSSSRKYKAFVGHRIAEILRNSQPSQWRWVTTKQNPADEATRPAVSPRIDSQSRWILGPNFLRSPAEEWPNFKIGHPPSVLEEEINTVLLTNHMVSKTLIRYENFSNYSRLKRAIAWVFRFIHNSRKCVPKWEGSLTAAEIEAAEHHLCKMVQSENFADELKSLHMANMVSKNSHLYRLSPYLEEDGLIRLHGRMDEAPYLPFAVKRPILMPREHFVSFLIIRYYHTKYHHQNAALILNEVRQKFWVIRAKSLLHYVQQNCMQCKLDKAKPKAPYMGQLPVERLTPFVRPFTYCGTDLFGPFLVAIGRRREKKWAVIFTCLTTRAVHLELAENLSTDAFIICFRNFVNRRGTPLVMRSDNGTNFIGAQKVLKDGEYLLDTDRLQEEASQFNMKWIFNCPANPSSGGCWERLIQIVKRLLQKTLQSEVPKLETLRSALIEAENILNARPLTDIPIACEDDEVLTPNHFLIGSANSTQTPNTGKEEVCLRKQWRISQMLKDRIWKKWTDEYLPQLIQREKWHDKPKSIKINDLVIICDSQLPRSQWKKGRVVQLFPAKDGHIRVVELKTATGIMRRPVSKLAVLTIECESDIDSRGGGVSM